MAQSVVSLINPEMKAAIEALAKSRKVSPSACLEAASIALAMQPYTEANEGAMSDIVTSTDGAASPPVVKPKNARVPRQAGAKSLEFREAIIAKADTLKGQRHTFAEIGTMFGIDQANAANNLKWLQSHKKIGYRVVGTAAKQQGQKGRAPAIIEFV